MAKVSDCMNWEEAERHIMDGHMAKLPEWAGHWRKGKDGNIIVETATGEILDTPFIDDYKNRTDWFLTDGTRTWHQIQPAIDAGKMAWRVSWRETDHRAFVFMRPKNVLGIDLIAKLNPIPDKVREFLLSLENPVEFSAYYCKYSGCRVMNGWLPKIDDLQAEDWEIVTI